MWTKKHTKKKWKGKIIQEREKALLNLHTLVNDKVGKDTPIKKPKATPRKVVKIILMVSFGFLPAALQKTKCKYFIDKAVTNLDPIKICLKDRK